jgi:hypothetical protein
VDIDALVNAIRQISSESVVLNLSDLLVSWKDSTSTATELEEDVERYIGNTWLDSTIEHEKIYSLWTQFRDVAIHGIGGMTMNERLYFFSLFPRWENAHTEEERKVIYAKLLAHP